MRKATSGNLPAETTSFIGRRRELAELRRQLASARLVTVVGPGGAGKSRLTARIASDLSRGFGHGAWLVQLADIREPALVANAFMAGLDLRDQTGMEPCALVLSHLRERQLLLVVDNCEHLLQAVAELISEILRAAPHVRVLATSREPLSVSGEHVVLVPPLELPAISEALARSRQNEAVMLFTERAAAATGGFELNADNQAAVIDICRRLDGLPLALELAAVRMRVLSVEQIRGRLGDRFNLLTTGSREALPRQQTLRNAMEWSHDLLTESERDLLRRLSVFAGRFTLEAVESVGGVAPTLEVLSALVDRSLVLKEESGPAACYRLHETVREFAALKLSEAGEQAEVETRCTRHYVAVCEQFALEARQELAQWLRRVDLEIDTIRAVLQRCLRAGDIATGLEVATSLGVYWITRATSEGTRWLDDLLEAGFDDSEATGWALMIRGFLAVLHADAVMARPVLARAIATARSSGPSTLLSCALAMAANAENMAGERAGARRFLEEAAVLAPELDDHPAMVGVLLARALDGLVREDVAAVRSAAMEGVRRAEAAGDLYTLATMWMNLGLADLIAGEAMAARPKLAAALRIAREIDDRVAQFNLLAALSHAAAMLGNAHQAARLLGAAESLRSAVGLSVNSIVSPMLIRGRAGAESALGRARFEADFKAGMELTRIEALQLALGEPVRPQRTRAAGPGPALGGREAEVAHLVGAGLTNKEIGARLFISERTVETHVRNLLDKLGFSSRAQIAGWIAAPDG
ncbi:MAG TPA: LuxR C-terminal-related transcriptional regulator [Candidatus Dormibacteraeota bacterium]|nr:LuxR C-terminal-related transcriptional regulator [Candidatus Dormibacteraeota bacterium]